MTGFLYVPSPLSATQTCETAYARAPDCKQTKASRKTAVWIVRRIG
jgi:hypothetical protein